MVVAVRKADEVSRVGIVPSAQGVARGIGDGSHPQRQAAGIVIFVCGGEIQAAEMRYGKPPQPPPKWAMMAFDCLPYWAATSSSMNAANAMMIKFFLIVVMCWLLLGLLLFVIVCSLVFILRVSLSAASASFFDKANFCCCQKIGQQNLYVILPISSSNKSFNSSLTFCLSTIS